MQLDQRFRLQASQMASAVCMRLEDVELHFDIHGEIAAQREAQVLQRVQKPTRRERGDWG